MNAQPKIIEMVARFHGALILLEKFDLENVRPRVETKEHHPPREFAVVATYLRSLAHIGTLIQLNNPSHFQAIAMAARSIFELAVDIRLIDRIDNAPEKYAAFSDFERLRAARRIVAFHATGKVEERIKHLWVYEKFIKEHAELIDARAKALWPNQTKPPHWSGIDLRQRAMSLASPFDEMYDVHYAELSWYTHPGVGAIASLEANVYPLVCATAYGVAARCYRETLRFMIEELRLADTDPSIDKKLEFARVAAFADTAAQAEALRRELLGS